MDFTRQPIIESIITPKEGCKLVVRSSKGVAQEEFFVDSLEVVSFSNFLFYRSLERPKCFIVPVSDYEVLEVRETRMVLKNVGVDRTIKIGGGRVKTDATQEKEKSEAAPVSDEEGASRSKAEAKNGEKKRERRRHGRRRRGRDEGTKGEEEATQGGSQGILTEEANEPVPLPQPRQFEDEDERREAPAPFSSILPPPSRLISETLERYREDESFRGVFLQRTEKEKIQMDEEDEEESQEDGQEENSPSEQHHQEVISDE